MAREGVRGWVASELEGVDILMNDGAGTAHPARLTHSISNRGGGALWKPCPSLKRIPSHTIPARYASRTRRSIGMNDALIRILYLGQMGNARQAPRRHHLGVLI